VYWTKEAHMSMGCMENIKILKETSNIPCCVLGNSRTTKIPSHTVKKKYIYLIHTVHQYSINIPLENYYVNIFPHLHIFLNLLPAKGLAGFKRGSM